jgi:hypothetical protein
VPAPQAAPDLEPVHVDAQPVPVQPPPIDPPPAGSGFSQWLQAAAVSTESAPLPVIASTAAQPMGPPPPPRLITVAIIEDPAEQAFQQAAKVDRAIVAPKSLDDALQQLQALTGNGTKIKRLYFLGHGAANQSDSSSAAYASISLGGGDFFQDSFETMKTKYPGLTNAFACNAAVTMLNCHIGEDANFVEAVANLFLRQNGGYVDAKAGYVAVWNNFLFFTYEAPEDPSHPLWDALTGDWHAWHREADSTASMLGTPPFTRWPPPPPPPPDSTISPEP